MISEIYKNRMIYYNLMVNFLKEKISAWEFKKRYWNQRDKDLDQNNFSGYSDYYVNRTLLGSNKLFEEKYIELLKEKGVSGLKEYEKGAQELDIKGEMVFMGMWYFIDEYVREYYPSDDEGFDPAFNIDEQMLEKIIQEVFDVLERNKDRWMIEEQNLEEEKSKEDNGQKI